MPIVKWVGGKGKMLPMLLRSSPFRISTYFEPFAGGAAMFFALQESTTYGKREVSNYALSDANKALIDTYKSVRDNVRSVISSLGKLTFGKEEYYMIRSLEPWKMTQEEQAARFIYLNRSCFNGLYRVSKSGRFNVPFGRYDNPTILDSERLISASKALTGVSLDSCDYRSSINDASYGDFVYLDPPYPKLSKTSNFTSYTESGFDMSDHRDLASCYWHLTKVGARAVMSNADTPEIRSMYSSYRMYAYGAKRSINSVGSKRGTVGELMIVNWGTPGVYSEEDLLGD